MALFVPNCGEGLFLTQILQDPNRAISLGLYTTNYTPAANDTLATYTNMEPTAALIPNYARQPLNPANWTLSAPPPPLSASYASVAFANLTLGNGQPATTVYGYFGVENNILVFASLLSASVNIPAAPGAVTVNTGAIVLVWGEAFASMKHKLQHKVDCADSDGVIDLRLKVSIPRR
jgi:hypothetical protein